MSWGNIVVWRFEIIRPVGPLIFRTVDAAVEGNIGRRGDGRETEAIAGSPIQGPAASRPGELPGFSPSLHAHFASQGARLDNIDVRKRAALPQAGPADIALGRPFDAFKSHRFRRMDIVLQRGRIFRCCFNQINGAIGIRA